MHSIKTGGLAAALALCFFASAAQAQTCVFRNGPDVIVGAITGPSNYSSLGGIEALSLGTTSCNLGDTNLNWFSSTNQHPVIGGNLYRYKDMGGWFAFEQVGMSWLKHGFFALSGSLCCSNCSSTNGTVLGTGCSDPYGSGLNGSQGPLGPRWQVDADTGGFTYPPANPSWSGSTARRLEVAIADLEVTSGSTTRYVGESQYVTPDDAAAGNQNNNASYREVSVAGSGSSWSFGFIGSTAAEQSAIRAWHVFDAQVKLVDVQLPGEGYLILGYRVTALGGGTWHYEFALYNMNSDDSIGAFELPIPTGVNLTNIGFHDVDYRNGDGIANVNQSGVDWTATQSGGVLRWETESSFTNPNANALRWGSTYNFRFDADTPPASGMATLSRFKVGGTTNVAARVPSAPADFGVSYCDDSDGALALCPCSNPGLPDTGCDNAQSTGGVNVTATAFAPDGFGGGTGTLGGSGFPASTTPTVVVTRSSLRESPPVVFGDGLRCVSTTDFVRLAATMAIGGTSSHALNHGAGAGTFSYQLWYRNTPAFCTVEAFNLSNGYDLTW